ncbi:MAG TPA: efflux RND transporter periplasmic adaptor subunit [Spirochaetota bacterium]|nr:efflux RND transporter periplasmic adaptor subunit [Spirochaetota bacterium]HPJ38995.1 efflux RND transporter periplasmic adaptor subunit [Spirochaetota bacterium]HPQ53788.1 efflux RND transporter periplasmic adaptor subunit [Spirochaetota bacterium]
MNSDKWYSKNVSGAAAAAAVMLSLVFITGVMNCKDSGRVSPEEGYYTCSMHPQVIQQEPGNCPICGMNLVFRSAGKETKHQVADNHNGHVPDAEEGRNTGNGENFRFSLARDLLQNAEVYTVPAKRGKFIIKKTYSGHVDFNEDPDKLVVITTKYDGWIEKLYVSKEGQRIGRGQKLMGVYSPVILAAQEEYLTTFQSLKAMASARGSAGEGLHNDPTIIAMRRKLQNLDVSMSRIRSLETTGNARRLTYFYSPISGIIVKKTVLQGSFIKAGEELFRIANLRNLWVFIHIFEKDLSFIKKGQRVALHSTAYPERNFTGAIDLIYPFFDMKTRDVKVRIEVPNTGYALKPGMYVNVDVSTTVPGESVIIPELAIIYSGERNYVFVSRGEGEFEIRPVVVGAQSEGRAMISKGLVENDLVVANGQFLLDSEASLKEALEKGNITGTHNH